MTEINPIKKSLLRFTTVILLFINILILFANIAAALAFVLPMLLMLLMLPMGADVAVLHGLVERDS